MVVEFPIGVTKSPGSSSCIVNVMVGVTPAGGFLMLTTRIPSWKDPCVVAPSPSKTACEPPVVTVELKNTEVPAGVTADSLAAIWRTRRRRAIGEPSWVRSLPVQLPFHADRHLARRWSARSLSAAHVPVPTAASSLPFQTERDRPAEALRSSDAFRWRIRDRLANPRSGSSSSKQKPILRIQY